MWWFLMILPILNCEQFLYDSTDSVTKDFSQSSTLSPSSVSPPPQSSSSSSSFNDDDLLIDTTTIPSITSTDDPCIIIGPNSIENLTVTIKSYTIKLLWKPSNCTDNYLIYLNNTKIVETNYNYYEINKLNACTNYNITIQTFYQNKLGPSRGIFLKTESPNVKNYKIKNFTINSIDNHLYLSWSPVPMNLINCIAFYILKIPSKGQLVITDNTSYVMRPLLACERANFSIGFKTKISNFSANNTITYIQDALPHKPPTFDSFIINKTWAIIKWNIYDNQTACTLKLFSLSCEETKSDSHPFIKNYTLNSNTNYLKLFQTNIDNLKKFTFYHCFGIIYNSFGPSNKSEIINFQTLEEVPPPISQMVFSNISSTSFNIIWQKLEKVDGTLLNYKVIIKSVGPLHYVKKQCLISTNEEILINPDEDSYFFEDAHPDYRYAITIFGIDGAGNGESLTEYVDTKTAIPEQCTNFSITFTDIFIGELSWISPCDPHGSLLNFQLVTSHFYIDSDSDQHHVTEIAMIERHSDESDDLYLYTILLEPANFYAIEIFANLNDNTTIGKKSIINFITKTTVPGAPILERIINETSSGFTMVWQKPFEKFGKILHYKVIIQPLGPLHRRPVNCYIFENTTEIITNGNVTQYTFNEALPHSNYSITLIAETSAGFGNNTKKFVQTLDAKTGTIRDFHLNFQYNFTIHYYETVLVSYDYPCDLNGPFKAFLIELFGQRLNYPDHNELIKIDETKFNFNLHPNYKYWMIITVLTENFSNTFNSSIFYSKSGVPSINNSLLQVPEENEFEQIIFRLPLKAFDQTNGDILYYALFITDENFNSNGNSYGFWWMNEWPEPPKHPKNTSKIFQITEPFWNPFIFIKNDTIYFEIGMEKNCTNHQSFCNKILESNKKYFLIVRALTENAYSDSIPLDFEKITESVNVILIVILIFCFLTTVILIGLFILWNRNKKNFCKKIVIVKPPSIDDVTIEDNPKPIKVKKFINYYNNIKDNGDIFKKQFSLLNTKIKELNLESKYAILPENKRKNRYTNILPYDSTRVKLQIDEDDEIASDYINAPYIKGYSGNVEYIATQGPLKSTSKDFWNMILQENITIIVMVSQFIEQNKDKCYKYFPNNHENMKFGDNLEVRCSTELHFGFYYLRKLQVKKNNIQRTVIHMQFLDWPDFEVPTGTENMLQFVQQLRTRIESEKGIIAIHCSAGVGRTGTLIVLDILLQMIEDNKDINIFETVFDLRKQRTNMVQTELQYKYIHICVKDYLENPSQFIINYNQNNEPLYENLEIIKSSLEDNLLPVETESAL